AAAVTVTPTVPSSGPSSAACTGPPGSRSAGETPSTTAVRITTAPPSTIRTTRRSWSTCSSRSTPVACDGMLIPEWIAAEIAAGRTELQQLLNTAPFDRAAVRTVAGSGDFQIVDGHVRLSD